MRNSSVTFASLLIFSFLSAVTLSTSANAQSQYTCEDIPALRQTLQDLQASCGGGGGNHGGGHGGGHGVGFCKAKGYIGDTAKEAVALCSAPGTPYGTQTCSDDLRCL